MIVFKVCKDIAVCSWQDPIGGFRFFWMLFGMILTWIAGVMIFGVIALIEKLTGRRILP